MFVKAHDKQPQLSLLPGPDVSQERVCDKADVDNLQINPFSCRNVPEDELIDFWRPGEQWISRPYFPCEGQLDKLRTRFQPRWLFQNWPCRESSGWALWPGVGCQPTKGGGGGTPNFTLVLPLLPAAEPLSLCELLVSLNKEDNG